MLEDCFYFFECFYWGVLVCGGVVGGVGLGFVLCEVILKVYDGCIEVDCLFFGGFWFSVVLLL